MIDRSADSAEPSPALPSAHGASADEADPRPDAVSASPEDGHASAEGGRASAEGGDTAESVSAAGSAAAAAAAGESAAAAAADDWDEHEFRDAEFRDAEFRDAGGDAAEDDDAPAPSEPIRLQKVLAAAGVGSRRKSEQLIVEGRVEVDGRVVRELGTRVDPDTAIIRVDGERLNLRADRVYLAFNKPRGVMSTMADEKGRESIATFVEDRNQRLFHVGRLDADSEGLILLTNDGELANRLMHPRYGVGKTYLVQVAAPVPRNLGRALIRGIELEDGLAKADTYDLLDVSGGRALIQLTIHEGRNRIVRRMMDAAGFPVQKLVRTAHGPITLGHLRSGAVRKLTRSELAALFRAVDL